MWGNWNGWVHNESFFVLLWFHRDLNGAAGTTHVDSEVDLNGPAGTTRVESEAATVLSGDRRNQVTTL